MLIKEKLLPKRKRGEPHEKRGRKIKKRVLGWTHPIDRPSKAGWVNPEKRKVSFRPSKKSKRENDRGERGLWKGGGVGDAGRFTVLARERVTQRKKKDLKLPGKKNKNEGAKCNEGEGESVYFA